MIAMATSLAHASQFGVQNLDIVAFNGSHKAVMFLICIVRTDRRLRLRLRHPESLLSVWSSTSPRTSVPHMKSRYCSFPGGISAGVHADDNAGFLRFHKGADDCAGVGWVNAHRRIAQHTGTDRSNTVLRIITFKTVTVKPYSSDT